MLPQLHVLAVFLRCLGGCLLQKLGDLVAVAEQPVENPPQVARGHHDGADGVSGEHPEVLDRVQIGRVFHRDHQPSVLHAQR